MIIMLDASTARDLFSYDPSEGLLRWRNAAGMGGRYPAGSHAGWKHKEGYWLVRVDRKMYRAARVIWLHVTGEWPLHQIDHKDTDPSNDKWENLRQATGSQNKANCRKYRDKSCDLKGVQAVQKKHSIRYRAIATKDGARQHLGYFDTPELAHAAYLKAAFALHGEFASNGTEPNHG